MATTFDGGRGLDELDGLTRDLVLTVLIHGPITRSELADRLGVSAPTLTRLAAPLVDGGLLESADEPVAGRLGRPARPLDIVTGNHEFVGIKLSGDSIHAVRTDLRARVLESVDARLEDHDPTAVVDAVERLVVSLTEPSAVTAIGISLGGSTPDHREVSRAPFLGWTGVPLAALVTERLGRPTAIENDLLAMTLAEQWFGDGRDIDNFAVLTIGAGVGYGLVTHRRLVTSPDAGVGLVGHFPVAPEGPWCADGHRGCADTMLSISGVRSQAAVALRRDLSYDDVLDLAEEGDPAMSAIVRESSLALGRLVAAVANLTMSQRIFVSGEGIRLAQIGQQHVRAGIARDRDPNASAVDLVLQPYESDLWARGAAVVAIQRFMLSSDAPAR